MRRPDWLQELRDLLALTSYDQRQQAMQEWEARWLIDLHVAHLITEAEHISARFNMLEYAAEYVRRGLGTALADLMGDLTVDERPHMWDGPTRLMEVRADAIAIRREPKIDA